MRPAWATALVLSACVPIEQMETDGGVDADLTETLSARGLDAPACRGAPAPIDIDGVWMTRFETASVVTGAFPRAQAEVVTRYGLATICTDSDEVTVEMLTCVLGQSPIADVNRRCAAQMPGAAMLPSLDPVVLHGTLSTLGPDATLILQGWEERWGLEAGAAVPREPAGAAVDNAAGVFDADADGDLGVTLRGDGTAGEVSFAVRRTRAEFVLEYKEVRLLAGRMSSTTEQAILGGPNAAALRGRTRAGASAVIAFVRGDGRNGAPRIDRDSDGRVDCAELAPFIGPVLGPPTDPGACRR
ncbi:MAG: hypothetical protein KC620_00955 [Myxococcales bacterium]|nr:hypothetical protein [Myxococcales bacterium]